MAETVDKKKIKKSTQKEKKVDKKVKKNVSSEKKSLLDNFRVFCNGVKSEFKRVHWPDKKEMIKYSIATIVFIIFFVILYNFL